MIYFPKFDPAGHGSFRNALFTIIELLVVIAIISVLAAMLLPVAQKAKNNSKEILCMSNLKQDITGQISYSSDYNGLITLLQYSSGGENVWHEFLTQNDYINSKKILLCPSWSPFNYTTKYATYGAQNNTNGSNPLYVVNDGTNTSIMVLPNKAKYPSFLSLLSDSIVVYPASTSYHLSQIYVFNYALSPHEFVHLRHNGNASTAFLDGHVEKCSKNRVADTAQRCYGNVSLYVADINSTIIPVKP